MATADEPPERDVKDFRYQQLCRFQIDDGNSPVGGKSPQLVAASSKYGVIIVGTSNGFKVIQTSELSRIDREHAKDRTKIIVKEYPCQASIVLSAPPSLLALSCDSLSLAVVVESEDLSQVYIYDTRSFVSQGNQSQPFLRIRLNCGLSDLAWNPENPTMLVCVMEDGSVSIFEAGDNLSIKATIPAQAKATCVCWSPKGKQLVVGQNDGLLAQYDQALVKKKEWTCPNILSGQQRVVGIIWLSTFSFMVAYIAENADASDQPTVVLITGSKEAPPRYTSLEDPCYGGGEERLKKFFFHYIPAWEMITATSSTAIEIAVLGKHFDNKTSMERWNLEDSARAEIPMTADHCEAYTMGVAIDFSSQMPLPLTEETMLPPCPIFLVLSSEGILIPFYMVYTHPETPVLTSAPAVLSADGARQSKASPVVTGTQSSAGIQPTPPAGPSFQFVSTKPAPSATASPFSFTSSTTAPPTVTPVASQATSTTGFGISSTQSTGFNFGAKPTSTSTSESFSTKPSMFGTPSSEPTSTKPSIFGTQASGASLFGSKPSSDSSAPKQSMFGVPAGSGSVLGTSSTGTSEPSSTKQGLFGTSVGGTSSFGSTPKTTPTAAPTSVFSAAPTGTGSGFSFSATPVGTSTSSTPATSSTSSTPISFNFAKPSGGTVSSSAPPASSNVPTSLFSSPVASKSFSTTASSNETGYYKPGPGLGGVTTGSNLPQRQPTGGAGRPEASKQGSQQSQPQLNVSQEGSKHKTVQPRVASSQSQQSQQEEETVDSTYTKSIMEEMTHFEEELKQFRNKTLSNKVAVGDIREMEKLKKKTEEMTKFNEEVKKLTKDQTKEIEDTKSLLLDSYSMIEECKMREQRNTDPKYIHLLKSKTLDPANQERLRALQQKYQILDRGLRECDTILDNQWQEYQNKNKKHARISTPTTDLIYRSIKSNRNVILHQNLELSDLESKLKQLKIYNKTSSWQDTFNESRSAELSSLADSLLESKSAPLSSSKVTETTSPQKMARLREHLSRRSVPRIKSTRPENLSMSRIVTASPVASRTQQRAPAVQNEAPVTNGFKGQQQFGQPNVRPQYQTSSIQQQARSLTGSSIRFQQTKPAYMNVGQSGMTISGDRNQSGGRYEGQPRMTEGFNAVKRSYGVLPPDDLRQTLSGIEDITPPSSTGYEEDEEDDETETETNDDEEGFGSQYNIPSQESSDSETEVQGSGKVTSTPLSSVKPDMPKSSPVVTSRNLFGSPKPSDGSTAAKSFSFGGTDTTKGFSFGGSTDSTGGAIPKSSNGFAFKSNAATATNLSEKVSSASSSKTSNTPSTGYNFGQTGSSKFGQTGTSTFGSESFSTTTGSSAGFDFTAGRKTDETKKDNSTSDLGGGESTADVSKSASKLSLDGTTFTAKPTGSSFSFSGGASSSQNITGLFGSKHNVQKTSSSDGTTKSKETVEGPTNENKPASGFSFSQSFGSIPPTGSSGVDTTPKTSKDTGSGQGVTTPNQQPSSSVSRSLFGSPTTGAPSPVISHATSSDDPKISSTGTGVFGTSSSSETGLFGKPAVSQSVSSTSNSTGLFGKTAVSQSESSTSNNTGLFGKPAVSQSESSTSNNTGLFGKKLSTDGQTPTVTSSETTASSETLNQQKEKSEETVTSSSGVTDEVSGSNVPPSNATGGGLFGQTSSATTGMFGQTTSAAGTGLFGQTTTTGASFGQSSSAASTIAPFGQGTTTSTTSPFGQTSTTTDENLFLQQPSSTPSSLFGQTRSTTSSGGLFGQTTTSSAGLFGQPSSSSSGLFGQPASSSGGLFGQTTSATSSGGLFGKPTSTSSSGGLFGQSTSTPTSGGMFGQTTSSPAGGLFGQPASSAGTSIFGQTASPAGTSVFGQPVSSTGTSVFGQPASSGSSGFGQPASPGGTSVFGQPVSSGSSGFGQPASSAGTSVFGQLVSSGSSGFGQTSGFGQKTTAPGFGQTAFGQTAFGQTSSSFGSTATTSSSGGGGVFGGSSFGGLGGQPSAERANTNVFGSSSFGTTTTSSAGSIFGNQGSSTFGAKSTSGFGGVGGFTSGGGSVAASGFGVAAQQTSPSGFGAPAAFGGSPSFGTAPAFGTSQAFGSSPTTFGGSGGTGFGSQPVFGNPVGGNTMFGGSPQQGQAAGFAGYGGTGSSPTFEALAGSSNVPTFGALSQQQSPGGGFGGQGGGGGGGFGSTQQQPGFGQTTPPSNPSFSGYRS